jgi:Common central domain of tyrosinase/Polyphenol oxidase middle domain
LNAPKIAGQAKHSVKEVVMARMSSLAVRTMFWLVLPLVPHGAYAQSSANTAIHVRLKWQDFVNGPDGAKRLASLEKAVAKMRSLDNSPADSADFRRSWKYWANIHGYLGPNSKFRTVDFQKDRLNTLHLSQFLPYLLGTGTPDKPGFQDQTPPDAIATAVWATCQHSPQGQQLNFFGWHRIYLYYFERVLRWAANDPALTLPYWDYTDPAQTALPDAFQNPNSPLYEWRRSEALNEGSATLNPQITDIDGPLTTDTSFLQYEGDIERGVHGNVHCSVGQTCPIPVMGLVGVAANDPIFYEHHANIDRMWSCWQHAHPDEKPGDWQDQEFSFVDENGALVKRPVKDFLNTKGLDYMYDNDSNCTRTSAPKIAVAQSAGPEQAASATPTPPIPLNATTTSVNITIQEPKLRQLATGLPEKTTLVVRDVSSQSDPGALLSVFVARKDAPNVREHVGTINWFGVFDPMEGMQHEGRVFRTFRFDISKALQTLGLSDTRELTVTFDATSGLVASAKRAASSKSLATPPAAEFLPGAALTVGAVEIQ